MIAYFCTEFALDSRLKIYAGGLGILAGDIVRQMGDEGKDFIGIGLYYYKGYLAAEYDWHTPESAGLRQVMDTHGEPLLIKVPIGERDVLVRTWVYQYKSVKVYLLDTLLHHNHPDDQKMSYFLYDQDVPVRLAQQMVLGIGGMRLLGALDLHPHVYHMNEGHSTFLGLEAAAGVCIRFTNHTVVSEGNHMYAHGLIRHMFARYISARTDLTMDQLLWLGECIYPDTFSMTAMAVHISSGMNAVSKLHQKKLQDIYPNAHPICITNGIHIPTWDKVGTSDIVHDHHQNKLKLLAYMRQQMATEWSPDTLVLGWARRLVQYKRPLAIFEDPLRLYDILSNPAVPTRIVLAGVPHPTDQWATDALHTILSLTADKFKNLIVYLPNYDPELASLLVAGCDVWMNTPVVGLEACGTSGIKAALNGTLQLSTPDGWMAETDIDSMGWKLHDESVAQSMYAVIEQEIIPAWSLHLAHPNSIWRQHMIQARNVILQQFSAKRMIADYEREMWGREEVVES